MTPLSTPFTPQNWKNAEGKLPAALLPSRCKTIIVFIGGKT
jgi:hypothetical protein